VYELQAPVVSAHTCGMSVSTVTDETTQKDDDNDRCVTNACSHDVGIGVCDIDTTHLVTVQREDPTLSSCWDRAEGGKGGFVIHNSLLYHRDQVEGQSVSQWCAPPCRRDNVLRMPNESLFDGHLGERKRGNVLRHGLRNSVNSCTVAL